MTWLMLTRAGSERDLTVELGASSKAQSHAEGVVTCDQRPRGPDGHLSEPAFARQAMRLGAFVPPSRAADALRQQIQAHTPRKKGAETWTWALQVVVPDSHDPTDPRRSVAQALEAELEGFEETVPAAFRDRVRPESDAARLVQAWVIAPDRIACGVTAAAQALSRVAGGRTKLKRPPDAVSRSGLKLEEAMQWAGVGPDKGDLCADLGSAPGGWTQVAVRRGATVIAVDPAKMKVDLPKKRYAHLQTSAFDYVPVETLDWVICDMAWRPLEVAQLLAKWGRRVWARQMIANFKLPMQEKAEILAQVQRILRKAGWQGMRARQLYHDRDEVTVFAYLDPGRVHLGAQPAFEMRSHKNRDPDAPAPRKAPRKGRDGRARGRGRNEPRGRGRGGARSTGRGRSAGRGRGAGRSSGRRRR